jgi:hypothetical protein
MLEVVCTDTLSIKGALFHILRMRPFTATQVERRTIDVFADFRVL